ncbi:glycosyltransferase 87 family protein [Propionicimonas sp.]|uniref:glycosyltransferase 87 family protein n=1 Tax=Propionicimonas sp. TaxID=1955623 RepID=UPI0018177F95|nr:glycosyltransferase 87 family protein [Propionicimonas sp.]MBU3976602.1 DUF2029 domain-containing protein [Actinomycetota bacterium]MBA3020398.1 DUF2029 domain-containing protein [Propionicimonas sp.]MBU3986571.1 DUF2029 domain-containing protein [Actinomycetota bacterium]MBU4065030.1 DUF2029 domain-containing protein [Actinomycetota bacterium]MBU4094543.1 DUF2029 domain-containing protein [Actinomycetota bacterium]
MLSRLRNWGSAVLLALAPLLAGFYVAAVDIADGSLVPWDPRMVDFEVYRRTAELVLAGADIFNVDGLPWVYPPFAAVLAVPLALPPWPVITAAWIVLCVAALAAVLFRLGLSGWRLSLLLVVAILFISPVRQTIAFGQLGILLVAAAVLDSMPGPRFFRRRILPEGWLTGLATAVKLTPAVIAVHNFVVGRRRPAWVAFGAFVVATAIGFAVLWGPSLSYWMKLGGGDSGTNNGIIYGANQSLLSMWARLARSSSMGGVWLSLLVLALGLWAAALMYRRGQARLALVLAGVAGLLASPISWSHHYVWVLPLAVILWQERSLPGYFRWPGLGYALWGMAAPFMYLPMGGDIEFTYGWWELVVDDLGIVAGVALLAGAVGTALGPWGRRGAQAVAQAEADLVQAQLIEVEEPE